MSRFHNSASTDNSDREIGFPAQSGHILKIREIHRRLAPAEGGSLNWTMIRSRSPFCPHASAEVGNEIVSSDRGGQRDPCMRDLVARDNLGPLSLTLPANGTDIPKLSFDWRLQGGRVSPRFAINVLCGRTSHARWSRGRSNASIPPSRPRGSRLSRLFDCCLESSVSAQA